MNRYQHCLILLSSFYSFLFADMMQSVECEMEKEILTHLKFYGLMGGLFKGKQNTNLHILVWLLGENDPNNILVDY